MSVIARSKSTGPSSDSDFCPLPLKNKHQRSAYVTSRTNPIILCTNNEASIGERRAQRTAVIPISTALKIKHTVNTRIEQNFEAQSIEKKKKNHRKSVFKKFVAKKHTHRSVNSAYLPSCFTGDFITYPAAPTRAIPALAIVDET